MIVPTLTSTYTSPRSCGLSFRVYLGGLECLEDLVGNLESHLLDLVGLEFLGVFSSLVLGVLACVDTYLGGYFGVVLGLLLEVVEGSVWAYGG